MAEQKIQIADKPTLDRILEIVSSGGSGGVGGYDPNEIRLMHYKNYGSASYVYENKDMLYNLYKDTSISLNDATIKQESFNYLLNNSSNFGELLSNIYGVSSSIKTVLVKYTTGTSFKNAITNNHVELFRAIRDSAKLLYLCGHNSTVKSLIDNSQFEVVDISIRLGITVGQYTTVSDLVRNNLTTVESNYNYLNSTVKSFYANCNINYTTITVFDDSTNIKINESDFSSYDIEGSPYGPPISYKYHKIDKSLNGHTIKKISWRSSYPYFWRDTDLYMTSNQIPSHSNMKKIVSVGDKIDTNNYSYFSHTCQEWSGNSMDPGMHCTIEISKNII